MYRYRNVYVYQLFSCRRDYNIKLIVIVLYYSISIIPAVLANMKCAI